MILPAPFVSYEGNATERNLVFITYFPLPHHLDAFLQHLAAFDHPEGRNVQLLALESGSDSETILKQIVPLLEHGDTLFFLSPVADLLATIVQAYRYLDRSFVYASVHEKMSDITLFYNVSKTVPDFTEPSRCTIARFDALGIQLHQNPADTLHSLEKTGSRLLRLGALKENIKESEPVLRDADVVHFDLHALKLSEAPGQSGGGTQSGLASEEAAQLARYAGMSDRGAVFFLSGFDLSRDTTDTTRDVLAQICWYWLDGYYNRKRDWPESDRQEMTQYTVESEAWGIDLVFHKSDRSGRWWLEAIHPVREKHKNYLLYACSYDDYLQAAAGEISANLVRAKYWFDRLA